MNHHRFAFSSLLSGIFLAVASIAQGTDYFVSKEGNDAWAGSRNQPFATIGKAASMMDEGDVCWISGGTYRETITPANDKVSFRAALGEKVVVSGYDPVTDWTVHSGSVYVADVSWNLGDENQVFFDKEMMTLARWPNKTNSNLFDLEMAKTTGTNSSLSHPDIPDQNWANGGVLLFLGKSRWTSWRVPITSSAVGKVDFDTLPTTWDFSGSHSPTKGGEFFLMNTLAALDAEREWYIDGVAGKVYFRAPGGVDPNSGEVLVRRRPTLVELSGRKGVELSNLEFFGGSLNLKNAEECVVKNCRIRYGNHTISTGRAAGGSEASISMDSDSIGNTIYRNEIQWGAGNGVVVKGVGNIVDNNIIGNFNYIGSYACPVEMRGTNYITRNEIFNAGRDCVRGGGTDIDFGFNNVHHSNLINDDCGGIYLCCGTYRGTRIHHNWIHDISSRNNNYESHKATGVYLDNSTVGVTVDHNVFWNLEWSCIQINWQGEDLEIHNNTFWSNGGPDSSSMKRWVNGYDFIDVNLYNTLANDGEFHANDIQNSCVLELDANPFENFAEQNFVPREGSCAIDGGREISGITDGFVGAAPDIGAYERGGWVWTPGPDWKLSDSLFVQDGAELYYTFDLARNKADLFCSNLTVGRGHDLLGSQGLGSWTVIDTFIAPDSEIYEYDDLDMGDFRFFRIAEKIAIPLNVNFVSASLQKDKNRIKLKFDARITDPSGEIDNMNFTIDGSPVPISSLTRDPADWSIVEVFFATEVLEGQVLRLSYAPAITGTSGGTIIPFVDEIVDTSISDANLVAGKNGDGELGNVTGWAFGEEGALNQKISIVESPVRSGQYAIQAIYDGDAGSGVVNLRHSGGAFEAKTGAVYDISIWHYGKDLDNIATYTTELSIYNALTGAVLIDKRTWKAGTPNQWNETSKRVSFTAQEAGDYVLGFRIYSGHYTIVVDDVTVRRVE